MIDAAVLSERGKLIFRRIRADIGLLSRPEATWVSAQACWRVPSAYSDAAAKCGLRIESGQPEIVPSDEGSTSLFAYPVLANAVLDDEEPPGKKVKKDPSSATKASTAGKPRPAKKRTNPSPSRGTGITAVEKIPRSYRESARPCCPALY
jgi:hypothetical protein